MAAPEFTIQIHTYLMVASQPIINVGNKENYKATMSRHTRNFRKTDWYNDIEQAINRLHFRNDKPKQKKEKGPAKIKHMHNKVNSDDSNSDDSEEEDDKIPHAAENDIIQLINNIPRLPREVLSPEPIRRNRSPSPDDQDEEIEMTQEECFTKFWAIITKLGIKGKEEEYQTIHTVMGKIRNLSPLDKAVFEQCYKEIFDEIKTSTNAILNTYELPHTEKDQIVGHICGLGKNWYENIMGSPELAMFLIDSKDYQSFHNAAIECFPNILKN